MRITTITTITILSFAGCKKKEVDPKPVEPSKPAASTPKATEPHAHQITMTKTDQPPKTFQVQAAIGSTGSGPAGFSVYLLGECPALPPNVCDWLPKGWVNLDAEKIKAQCPDYQQLVIRFSYDDQMKPVLPSDLKAGAYGRTSQPIHGSAVHAGRFDGKGFQVHGENLVEITSADATHVAGKIDAKSPSGTVTGTFDAKVCQYP